MHATGDDAFERDIGLDILVETARLWRSLGHYDLDGSFRIDGVTGPDEYSAIADNNVYTNLMAQRNLRRRRRRVPAPPGPGARARRHARGDGGLAGRRRARRHPVRREARRPSAVRGFHASTSRGISRRRRPDQYPLLLHFPYFDLYRKQVVKQPDLVLAMQLCSDAFTPEQRARNFEYYERITVRDSSLSACTEAVAAADAGHLRLAFDYAAEAALMDLHDLEHNTRDGLHVASLAGTWIAFVVGFGGMRDHGDTLAFTPRLPDGLTRLTFSLLRRGCCLHVDVSTTRRATRCPGARGRSPSPTTASR